MIKEKWLVSIIIRTIVLYSLYNPIKWLVTFVVIWEVLVYIILIILFVTLISIYLSNITIEKSNIYTVYKAELIKFLEVRTPISKYCIMVFDAVLMYFSLFFGDISLTILFALLLSFNVLVDNAVKALINKINKA